MDPTRDSAILKAALQLVGEVGYERVTMDAIAARCHASKATIYRRWDSKASLIVDAVRDLKEDLPCIPDTGDVRSDLITGLRAVVEHANVEDLAICAGLMTASHRDKELAQLLSDKMVMEKRAQAREWADRAVARGQLPGGANFDLILEIVPALLFMRLLVTGEPVDEQFVTEVVDDVLLPLFTCRPPSADSTPAGTTAFETDTINVINH